MNRQDTIAAISTPLGEGGIGIVRMSGPQAIEIAERVFRPTRRIRLSQVLTHTVHHGYIHDGERRVDEVLVTVMRAPRTYTREDVVEINCHGGIAAVRAVLDLLLRHGARLADRGEFTRRAFINGRISLDQAQAVLAAVQAQTRLGLEAAVEKLGGRFRDEISSLRRRIADLLAEIEVGIDYPDVDADTGPLRPALQGLRSTAEELVHRAARGKVVREGVTAAIAGRPNVGKSTLLNAILSEERAIVTPIPGTTRDTVEEVAEVEGIPIRLVDTAGLHEPADAVEEEGVKRAQRAIDRADIVLLVLDRSFPLTSDDRALLERRWEKPVILVLNKSDLSPAFGRGQIDPAAYPVVHEISALTGAGVEELTRGIVSAVLAGGVPAAGSLLLLDSWERDLLRRTADALARAAGAAEGGTSPDIIAEELRIAYREAGRLQGIDVSEDVLDRIFSRFCVGK